MVHRVQVRVIDDEGNELLRIVRRSSGSVVTRRRAQLVLLSALGMDVPMIVKVTFAGPDRPRDVLHNSNADGFDPPRSRYTGGRPPRFSLPQRQEIKKIALARPTDTCRRSPPGSPSEPAAFLVGERGDDISHEGLRTRCCASRASPFQAVKTWKTSTDPDYAAQKNRVLGAPRHRRGQGPQPAPVTRR